MTPYPAVVFDLGGVVLGSPLHEIAAYEREHALPEGLVNRVVMGNGFDGAWSRHERGELDFDAFCMAFQAECEAAGGAVDVREMMRRIDEVTVPRPEMLDAIDRIRASGRRVAALTNNWSPITDERLKAHFDVVVESSIVGYRKPQQEIYQLVLAELELAASHAVFLDDIGANLKAARALGFATIKVVEPGDALDELGGLLGMQLR